MKKFLVTKDLPVTMEIEAESEEDVQRIMDAYDPWPAVYAELNVFDDHEVVFRYPVWIGDWYDDIAIDEQPPDAQ